jgi:hypothetical protein
MAAAVPFFVGKKSILLHYYCKFSLTKSPQFQYGIEGFLLVKTWPNASGLGLSACVPF